MPTILIKRGTTTPTTGNLTNLGEMAFNYNSNELYIRSSSSVIKVNGSSGFEKVFNYEGAVQSYDLSYSFDRNYIYKVHVMASASGTSTSNTQLSYGGLAGSSIVHKGSDNYTTISTITGKNLTLFNLYDGYTNSVAANYATTKVIDFELSPAFETSLSSGYTWMAYGISVCGASDQSNSPITTSRFSHVIDVTSLTSIYFYPNLSGTYCCFSITLYRMPRK